MGIYSANNIIIRSKPQKVKSGEWYAKPADLKVKPTEEVVYHNPNYHEVKNGILHKLFNKKSDYLMDMTSKHEE